VEASADRTTTSAETLTVQFSSEGSRDPDGDPVTYEWDFGDGSPASTERNPVHTYTAVGTYRATLTITDSTGRSGSGDVTIVVGNAAPSVEMTSPAEGGFFAFGDRIPFEVTAVDDEDGTVSGDHPACARMRVGYLLGHDEHSHPITDATGCRGTFQTTGEAGHGEDANVFGLLSATYTDGGGRPGVGPLSAQDGVRVWPKLLQAEHYTDQRGVIIYAVPGAAGGEQVGSTEDDGTEGGVNYIAWDPVNLTGIDSLTVRAAAGGDGGPIEVRLGDPVDGQLLGTIDVPNTGGWETMRDFELDIEPPAGRHKLFFAFPTGGMDVDQIRFNGTGIASPPLAVTATARPSSGRAPLRVVFQADGPPGTYAWDFGDGATSNRRRAVHRYTAPGTYTATVTVTDRDGGTGSDEVEVTVTPR
jgi:cytochrome c